MACLLKEMLSSEVPLMTIVDVGAMAEGQPRYQSLLDHYSATVLGFEPNEIECRKLQNSAPPTHRYLPFFLGRGDKSTFRSARYPGCSSLFEPNGDLINLFTSIGSGPGGNFEILKTMEVQTHRLDDVYLERQAHLLKLDIQGGELAVLEGAVRTLQTTLVIEVEVEFVPLYKNQPLFGDIQRFLQQKGFMLHKLIDCSGRCLRPFSLPQNPFLPMSQMLWADAIFVRDFTDLESLKNQELLIMTAILHDVYHSYDLAHFILSYFDKRNRTIEAQSYMNRLRADSDLQLLYLNQKVQP